MGGEATALWYDMRAMMTVARHDQTVADCGVVAVVVGRDKAEERRNDGVVWVVGGAVPAAGTTDNRGACAWRPPAPSPVDTYAHVANVWVRTPSAANVATPLAPVAGCATWVRE